MGLVVAETPSQAQRVTGVRSCAGGVGLDTQLGRAAVVVTDLGQCGVVEGVVSGGAGGGGLLVGVGEGVGHCLRPQLLFGVGGVHRTKITQEMFVIPMSG
jgi:hypothetical protein